MALAAAAIDTAAIYLPLDCMDQMAGRDPMATRRFTQILAQSGVEATPEEVAAARTLVDRWIEQQVARLAFGDSTAFRRRVREDAQLLGAMDVLRRSRTQAEVFAYLLYLIPMLAYVLWPQTWRLGAIRGRTVSGGATNAPGAADA